MPNNKTYDWIFIYCFYFLSKTPVPSMFTGGLSWRYRKMTDVYPREVRLLKSWQSDEPEAMAIVISWCGFTGLWTLLLSVVPLLFLPFVHLCRQLPWNFSFSPALQFFPLCLCSLGFVFVMPHSQERGRSDSDLKIPNSVDSGETTLKVCTKTFIRFPLPD